MNFKSSVEYLTERNHLHLPYSIPKKRKGKLQKVLIANRAEIAKKFFETLREENIPSVAVVTDADLDQSWYEMANEVVFIGDPQNYFNIDIIIHATFLSNANAIYPGYGFLSENYNFVKRLEEDSKKSSNKIIFMGPSSDVLKNVGSKIEARKIAEKSNVPLFKASSKISHLENIEKEALKIGYPVMIKLNAGGGGRGIIPVFKSSQLLPAARSSQRLGKNLYNDDSIYIEKYIAQGVHIEVQIFNNLAVGIRKCAMQRNHQKLLEENGEFFLNENLILSLFSSAENISKTCGYSKAGVGTVEFLLDIETGEFGFLEVNPRLQVEYAVTEQALEIDIVKWQIMLFDERRKKINYRHVLKYRFQNLNHAIECRIYAEDPENNYLSSPGEIKEIYLTASKKVRYDFGFSVGDTILPDYDNLIGKLIASGRDRQEAISHLKGALKDIYIKGVDTNIPLFINILKHPIFLSGNYGNNFLAKYKEVYDIYFDDEKAKLIAVLGVLSNHVHLLNEKLIGSFFLPEIEDFTVNIRSFLNSETYKVSFGKGKYNYIITLIQVDLYSYHVFIENIFYHSITIFSRLEQNDNFLVKSDSNTYKVKLDVSKEYIRINVQDDSGSVEYCKMQVLINDPENQKKILGEKRAPFQCQFVKLFPVNINERVKKGQPIITISAMKMEMTLNAPISGKINYLIENGDITKLELNKTSDDLIIGRAMKEGELLFSIKNDSISSSKKGLQIDSSQRLNDLNKAIKYSFENIGKNALKNGLKEILPIYKSILLIRSYLLGFIFNEEIILPILDTFSDIDFNLLPTIEQNKLEDTLIGIMNFYVNIQELHSYTLKKKHSNFDEMSVFYSKLKKNDFSFQDLSIKPLLDDLFGYYGVNDWEYRLLKKPTKVKIIFWYMERSIYICRNSVNIIKILTKVISKFGFQSKKSHQCFEKLLAFEETNRDESLYSFLHLYLEKELSNFKKVVIKPAIKWTIEEWAKQTFDANSFREITFKSIDFCQYINPKTEKKEIKKVGSKVYLGNINERLACFYMKDSRISGGATGNLEGLKYIAACLIALFKNIPLYVWNDGAGANIKEGMISLNRAAEGFMLNSIIGEKFAYDKIHEFIFNSPDQKLHELFSEIQKEFYSNSDICSSFIVSIGIGSSTGLDVYGASQSAIQIILDTESAYRVLTGSNVIKSVTGEIVSNYEIGGAKIMGYRTGTVDLVAKEKSEIIDMIKKIQTIFCELDNKKSIQRKKESKKDKKSSLDSIHLLNEELIKDNVDNRLFLGLKGDYHGSNSTLGGLASLGGRNIIIIGSRTHFGVRSLPGIIKAEELLRIAHKTGSHQIFIFGAKSYHRTIDENSFVMRARRNFVQTLAKKSKLRIHILTHINSIYHITVNLFADIIIFVQYESLSKKEIKLINEISTFVVGSISEGFDVSHKLIKLLDPIPSKSKKPKKYMTQVPKIPKNTVEPFDIIANVILKISDKKTFTEFFEHMNDKISGPSLITGVAEINGKPTGIMADQPIILGGAPESVGTEKFRIFLQFLQKNNLPLLMISNSPGFLPGKKQEQLRIQQIGGKSLDDNILSTIPVVSITLNQNYGGRFIHAFAKHLRPGIVNLAFIDSILAVMGAKTSFDLFLGKKYQKLIDSSKNQEASNLKKEYMNNFNKKARAQSDIFSTGGMDWLIKKREDLKKHIICGLELSKIRREILDDSNKIVLLKKQYLNVYIRIFELHNIKANINGENLYLKKEKKEISFEEIQKFIRGYNSIPSFIYEDIS